MNYYYKRAMCCCIPLFQYLVVAMFSLHFITELNSGIICGITLIQSLLFIFHILYVRKEESKCVRNT